MGYESIYEQDGLFYKHKENGCTIEGYIGNKEEFKGVLFLLREPNTSEKKTKNDKTNKDSECSKGDEIIIKDAYSFWVRDIAHSDPKEHDKNAKKYFNALNNILNQLLKTENCNLLKKAAYINLHPFKGGSKVDTDYTEIRKAITPSNRASYKKISPEHKNLVESRIKIIEELDGLHTVITTIDIFEKLSKRFGKSKAITSGFHLGDKEFQKFVCTVNNKDNKEITFYSFYHPAARKSYQYKL